MFKAKLQSIGRKLLMIAMGITTVIFLIGWFINQFEASSLSEKASLSEKDSIVIVGDYPYYCGLTHNPLEYDVKSTRNGTLSMMDCSVSIIRLPEGINDPSFVDADRIVFLEEKPYALKFTGDSKKSESLFQELMSNINDLRDAKLREEGVYEYQNNPGIMYYLKGKVGEVTTRSVGYLDEGLLSADSAEEVVRIFKRFADKNGLYFSFIIEGDKVHILVGKYYIVAEDLMQAFDYKLVEISKHEVEKRIPGTDYNWGRSKYRER